MRNDGGPAFPSHGTMGEVVQRGLSLRDYFAAAVVPSAIHALMDAGSAAGATMRAAKIAYEVADAMLAERERPKPPLEVTEADREQGATDMERAYPRREP